MVLAPFLTALLLSAPPALPLGVPLARAEPAWQKKKKELQEQKEKEEREKAVEKPAIGPDTDLSGKSSTSDLTSGDGPKYNSRLLFKQEGATDSLAVEYGRLNQPELGGLALHGQYAFSWWATPRITAGFYARLTGVFETRFTFLQATPGILGRWYPFKNLLVGAQLGFGWSQGVSRIPQGSLPLPPSDATLATRWGYQASVQLGFMLWPSRTFALGPVANLGVGSQAERTQTHLTLGITFQSGRPEYGGDLTAF